MSVRRLSPARLLASLLLLAFAVGLPLGCTPATPLDAKISAGSSDSFNPDSAIRRASFRPR
jgi:hypothetical protein